MFTDTGIIISHHVFEFDRTQQMPKMRAGAPCAK